MTVFALTLSIGTCFFAGKDFCHSKPSSSTDDAEPMPLVLTVSWASDLVRKLVTGASAGLRAKNANARRLP